MKTASISSMLTVGGETIPSTVNLSAEGAIGQEPEELPAGSAGTVTDNPSSEVTLDEGHGITDQDTVDLFWAGGLRRGMTATVVENVVTLAGGAGDSLPADSTPVVMCTQQTIDKDYLGDLLVLLAVIAMRRCCVEFFDASDTSLLVLDITAGGLFVWYDGCGFDNPLATKTVAYATFSCGDTTAGKLNVEILYNSVS